MKSKRILIMGLPGSGKTFLAGALKRFLEENSSIDNLPAYIMSAMGENPLPDNWHATVDWFNADDIRKKYNDWDFSNEGRIRQSLRMLEFALRCNSDYVICDFVAPLPAMRDNFNADFTIWVDTITSGRFEDTNKMFVPPSHYDFRVTEQDAERWAAIIGTEILNNK